MWNYFKEIITGFWSLCVGMWIVLIHAFRRPVTVQYPYQTAKIPARYRGHIQLKFGPATGKPKCIVCMACQRACPSACIELDGVKPEGAARKELTRYQLNFTSCSLCGLCVESCNFDALEFSREYNLANRDKETYRKMDLLTYRPTHSVAAADKRWSDQVDAGNAKSHALTGAATKTESTGKEQQP